MHAIPQAVSGLPDWRTLSGQRLQLSMLVSAVLVLGLLSMLRFPMPGPLPGILELIVDLAIAPPRMDDVAEMPSPESPAAGSQPHEVPARQSPAASEAEASVLPQPAPQDWEALRDEAVTAVLDEAEKEASWSVNPPLEKARKEARVRFRASRAPPKQYIWDNVEKDQVGRTILRSGNCYRVLDDPSAANRWAYETFDQYLVFCGTEGGSGEPPTIGPIPDRYEYLDDIDADNPQDR